MIMTKYTSDAVPLFLSEFADSMFVCGKAINLLKLIAPQVAGRFNYKKIKCFAAVGKQLNSNLTKEITLKSL